MPVICEKIEHEQLEKSDLTLSDQKDPSDQKQTGKKKQATPQGYSSVSVSNRVCCNKKCTIF